MFICLIVMESYAAYAYADCCMWKPINCLW